LQQAIGFVAVLLGAANAAGGYVVTERMLAMFKARRRRSNGYQVVLIDASYFVAAILFILGLKGMSSPVSARKGIMWAGVGMVACHGGHLPDPGMQNFGLMVMAIAMGGALAWVSGKKVAMTDMPQMVAIYNGMGGGAAAAIAAVEFARGEMHGPSSPLLAVLGALIGAVSFSGSRGLGQAAGVMKSAFRLPAQNAVNIVLALATVALGVAIVIAPQRSTRCMVAPSSCSRWCSA
jgi:NAD(P) transhydrogenase subunit beta